MEGIGMLGSNKHLGVAMLTAQLDISVCHILVQYRLKGGRRPPEAIPFLLFARITWEIRRLNFSLHLKEKKRMTLKAVFQVQRSSLHS